MFNVFISKITFGTLIIIWKGQKRGIKKDILTNCLHQEEGAVK